MSDNNGLMSLDRVAVVTGAGRGLGSAIALRLAEENVAVVLAGRSVDQLAAVQAQIVDKGGTALAVPTDVTSAESVQALFATCVERFGRLDVLVNNAGIAGLRNLVDLDEAEWERIF